MPRVQPIPEQYTTITPALVVPDVAAARDWYQQAFDAAEYTHLNSPDGTRVIQSHLRIGDAMLILNEQAPDAALYPPLSYGGTPVTIHLYVTDVDTLWRKLMGLKVTVIFPLQDVYWGDRFGKVADPFGHHWSVASRRRDLKPKEIQERAEKIFGIHKEE